MNIFLNLRQPDLLEGCRASLTCVSMHIVCLRFLGMWGAPTSANIPFLLHFYLKKNTLPNKPGKGIWL